MSYDERLPRTAMGALRLFCEGCFGYAFVSEGSSTRKAVNCVGPK